MANSPMNQLLIDSIATVITQARSHVRQTVNSAMVQSYWEIGRLLVEDEQQGADRAQYGKYTLKTVSERTAYRIELDALSLAYPN